MPLQLTLVLALTLFASPMRGATQSPPSCGSIFKAQSQDRARTPTPTSDIATNASSFLDRHIPDSGLVSFSKPQLVTLFSLRDRILAGDATRADTRIATDSEAQLVSQITKRVWNIGDAVTIQQFENRIALPAFKRLAFKAARLRMQIEPGVDPDEIYQAAFIGLLEAIRAYRVDADAMFSTWALMMMKTEFYDVARESTSGLALAPSAGSYSLLVSFLRVATKLERQLGRVPTDAEVLEAYKKLYARTTTESAIAEARNRSRVIRSISSTHRYEFKTSQDLDEESAHEFDTLDLNSSQETPATLLEAKQTREALVRLLFTLWPRDRKLLGLRIGLDTHSSEGVYSATVTDTYTLDEIGQMYGMNKENIRKVQEHALRTLRRRSGTNDFESLFGIR